MLVLVPDSSTEWQLSILGLGGKICRGVKQRAYLCSIMLLSGPSHLTHPLFPRLHTSFKHLFFDKPCQGQLLALMGARISRESQAEGRGEDEG